MGVTNGVQGPGVRWRGESALCCPVWAPLLGFVPSAALVVGTTSPNSCAGQKPSCITQSPGLVLSSRKLLLAPQILFQA